MIFVTLHGKHDDWCVVLDFGRVSSGMDFPLVRHQISPLAFPLPHSRVVHRCTVPRLTQGGIRRGRNYLRLLTHAKAFNPENLGVRKRSEKSRVSGRGARHTSAAPPGQNVSTNIKFCYLLWNESQQVRWTCSSSFVIATYLLWDYPTIIPTL